MSRMAETIYSTRPKLRCSTCTRTISPRLIGCLKRMTIRKDFTILLYINDHVKIRYKGCIFYFGHIKTPNLPHWVSFIIATLLRRGFIIAKCASSAYNAFLYKHYFIGTQLPLLGLFQRSIITF